MKKYFILNNYHKRFLKYIYSPFVSSIESCILRYFLKKTIDEPLKHKPVFILGIPRSGTTFIYQVISSIIPCLYVDNFVEKFSSSPIFAFKVRNLIWNERNHESFTSSYGVTSDGGVTAPNQGINFWYHWFPNRNHYHAVSDLSPNGYRDIDNTIHYLINKYDKPLLFKELSLSQKLPIIRRLFPESKFIIVERDLAKIAIKILHSMEKHKIDDGVMWGGFFKGYERFLDLDKKRMVAHQIVYLKHYMDQGLSDFKADQVLRIDFDDLYVDPNAEIEKVSTFLGISSSRTLREDIIHENKVYAEDIISQMNDFINEAKENLSRGWNLK